MGYSGTGEIRVENGGEYQAGGGFYTDIGEKAGSGSVTITGAGSRWTGNSSITVGSDGNGSVLVTNEGNFSSGSFTVGGDGDGSVTVSNGGSLTTTFEHIIGLALGSQGSVTVTGAGSEWNMLDNVVATIIGNEGRGELTVSNGGTVFIEQGSIRVGTANAGLVHIKDGGTMISHGGQIGSSIDGIAGNGIVKISGDGSRWTSDGSGRLSVGSVGTGEFRIENGGEYQAGNSGYFDVYVGENAGSGSVMVIGAGSKWTNSDRLAVGYNSGKGSVTVSNSGSLSTGDVFIGGSSLSQGSMTVTGTGSELNINYGLKVGERSTGELTVSNGGTVNTNLRLGDSQFSESHIGFLDGSNGTVTVTGAGSVLNVSSDLFLGGTSSNETMATGVLNIQEGGTVVANGTVKVRAGGTIHLEISNNHMFQINDSWAIDNNGLIRFTAAPDLVVGTYTPVQADGAWSGAGGYETIGGTWNLATREFTVAAAQSTIAGSQTNIDLTSTQRLKISGLTHQVMVAFDPNAQADSGGSEITFTGTENSTTEIGGGEVLSAWDFDTNLDLGAETQLSMEIGAGVDSTQLEIWHSTDGVTWTQADAEITYDGLQASFTVDSFSSYAVVLGPPLGFENWASGEAPNSDSNGDGVPALAAYALGALSTDENARPLLPVLETTGAGATYGIGFTAHEDVAYEIHVSEDLSSWYRVAFKPESGTWQKDIADDATPVYPDISALGLAPAGDGIELDHSNPPDSLFIRSEFLQP